MYKGMYQDSIIKKPSYCDDLMVLINKYEKEFSDFGKEIIL